MRLQGVPGNRESGGVCQTANRASGFTASEVLALAFLVIGYAADSVKNQVSLQQSCYCSTPMITLDAFTAAQACSPGFNPRD